MRRVKDAARGDDRVAVVDERFVGPVADFGGQTFLQVVQLQQQGIVEAFI